MAALRLANDWPRLLSIVDWLRRHPQPGIYLRQMDLPGVHTKFVERHRAILGDLLDRTLPVEYIDTSAVGAAGFNRRYGFLDKPERVRFRWLDKTKAILPETLGEELTLSADAFARLEPNLTQVFITENEINYLAFPDVPDSLLLFGGGYGFEMLGQARWLERCRIRYWGDIDTHGFVILDQLRSRLPHVESLLMDRETLLALRPLWGVEPAPAQRTLSRLTPDEAALHEDLRTNRLGDAIRLEQERIPYSLIRAALV